MENLIPRRGDVIASLRIRKGYSAEQFADMIGVSLGHLSQLENNRKKPSAKRLKRIAVALGTTVENIIMEYLYERSMKDPIDLGPEKLKLIVTFLVEFFTEVSDPKKN